MTGNDGFAAMWMRHHDLQKDRARQRGRKIGR
jgi:hypothetical protein